MDPYNSADVLAPARPAAPALPSYSGVQPGVPLPSAWLSNDDTSGGARTGGSNPYSAPHSRLEDLRGHSGVALASRAARLGSRLLDALLVYVPVGFVLGLIAYPMYRSYSQGLTPQLSANAGLLLTVGGLYLLGMSIYNLILLAREGQTLGRKIVGIRIVRSDGERASLSRLIVARGLPSVIVGAIPYVNLLTWVDILWIFGPAKRCIHDYIADTIVVDA